MSASPFRMSSLLKKYLMALSGLVLVLFVLGHMLGNLLFLVGPEAINAYAYHLHHLPGAPFSLWAIRLFLLAMVGIHVWMAVLLTIENRQARPDKYLNKSYRATKYAARTMPMTGLIILAFIIFHILQFTTRVVPEHYEQTIGQSLISVGPLPADVLPTFDVYAMMVAGFSSLWVSLFYIIAVGLLCMHLAHGVSSMFQSIGIRNEQWRYRLGKLALAYGWIIFIGFASIPVSVMGFGSGKGYLEEKRQQWQTEGSIELPAHHLSHDHTQGE